MAALLGRPAETDELPRHRRGSRQELGFGCQMSGTLGSGSPPTGGPRQELGFGRQMSGTLGSGSPPTGGPRQELRVGRQMSGTLGSGIPPTGGPRQELGLGCQMSGTLGSGSSPTEVPRVSLDVTTQTAHSLASIGLTGQPNRWYGLQTGPSVSSSIGKSPKYFGTSTAQTALRMNLPNISAIPTQETARKRNISSGLDPSHPSPLLTTSCTTIPAQQMPHNNSMGLSVIPRTVSNISVDLNKTETYSAPKRTTVRSNNFLSSFKRNHEDMIQLAQSPVTETQCPSTLSQEPGTSAPGTIERLFLNQENPKTRGATTKQITSVRSREVSYVGTPSEREIPNTEEADYEPLEDWGLTPEEIHAFYTWRPPADLCYFCYYSFNKRGYCQECRPEAFSSFDESDLQALEDIRWRDVMSHHYCMSCESQSNDSPLCDECARLEEYGIRRSLLPRPTWIILPREDYAVVDSSPTTYSARPHGISISRRLYGIPDGSDQMELCFHETDN